MTVESFLFGWVIFSCRHFVAEFVAAKKCLWRRRVWRVCLQNDIHMWQPCVWLLLKSLVSSCLRSSFLVQVEKWRIKRKGRHDGMSTVHHQPSVKKSELKWWCHWQPAHWKSNAFPQTLWKKFFERLHTNTSLTTEPSLAMLELRRKMQI